MYIRKIEIESIRCFGGGSQKVDLDLQRPDGSLSGWTVIAGRNGAGKSTFLKAIALAVVGPLSAAKLETSFAGWIRQGAPSGSMSVQLEPQRGSDGFSDQGSISEQDGFWTTLKLVPQSEGPEPRVEPERYFANPERGPWAENPKGWFLAGYGPFRRLSGHTTDSVRLMTGPSRLARLVTLFREDASLHECTEWLRNEVYLRRLEQRPEARQLEENVIKLLNDGLLPDGVKIDHIDSEGLWTERDGLRLLLRDLSDGYRTVVTLVLDLVKQLYNCYGRFDVQDTGGVLVVNHPGVVLIDEMDIHLHIEWQQKIGFWLKQHFARLQFLVTSHSPFICQAADPKGLIRLPAPGSGEAAAHVPDDLFNMIVHGGADAAAMSALFGLEKAHSDRSEELRLKVAHLEAKIIRGRASEEEMREHQKLCAKLPETGSMAVERVLRAARKPS